MSDFSSYILEVTLWYGTLRKLPPFHVSVITLLKEQNERYLRLFQRQLCCLFLKGGRGGVTGL